MKRSKGFTVIEMLITLALVGIAASVALPLLSLAETRSKEVELRRSLRVLRQAIDSYKTASEAGAIDRETGASGFPPSLKTLTDGVHRSKAIGYNATPLYFLRSIPRDPFNPDRTLAPEMTWNIRGSSAKAGDFSRSKDVFDISSKSERIALDGTKYSDW